MREHAGGAPKKCSAPASAFAVFERLAIPLQILDHLGLPTEAAGLRAQPDRPGDQAADPTRELPYELLFDDLRLPDPANA